MIENHDHSSKPQLSIVMPVFNRPAEVRIILDSILANDFDSWEVIAVDDGSDQPTLDLLHDYASRDARIIIKVREQQPKGAQTCRNIGLEQARGEFMVFFDSDDYITPTCLRTRVEQLSSHPELDFMVFPSGIYNSKGFTPSSLHFTFGYPIYSDDLWAFASRNLPFIVWSNIYRTSSLRKYGMHWDTNLLSFQDSDFNIQALLSGMKYDYAPTQPDYGYRIEDNPNAITNKIHTISHFNSQLYAIEKFYTNIQSHHGHRYDRAIYHGCMTYYIKFHQNGLGREQAVQLLSVIKKHSRLWGHIFSIQLTAERTLRHVTGSKAALLIALFPFFIVRKVTAKLSQRRKARCMKKLFS